jgi:voltage-gated potassium channel
MYNSIATGGKRKRCQKIMSNIHVKVRLWLNHKEGGIMWDMYVMVLCIVSVLVYILQTYAESQKENQMITLSEEEYTITLYIEFFCALNFMVDLIINVVASRRPIRYLLCGWGTIDVVTVVPVILAASYSGFKKELGNVAGEAGVDARTRDRLEQYAVYTTQFMAVLRFARVLKITRFLREMRLQKLFRSQLSAGTSQILSAGIFLIAVWFLAAGVVYFVECEIPALKAFLSHQSAPSNGTFVPFEKPMTFGDSLYFSVITMTTVGYGDFSPKTASGMWVVVFVVIVGIVVVSDRVTLIAEICSRQSKYRKPYRGLDSSNGHIIIMGDGINDIKLLVDILAEHFHPDNAGTDDRPDPEDVVILGQKEPYDEMKHQVLNSFLGEKIQYYVGSILSTSDLEDIKLRDARSVFILASGITSSILHSDHQNIVDSLVVREYDPHATIMANCHLIESAEKIASVGRPQMLLCNDEMRTNLIGCSLACPGLQTFFDNLTSAFDFERSRSRPKWLEEYFEGASKEIYCIPCPLFLGGKTFLEIALLIFRINNQNLSPMILIAAEANGVYVSNPGPSWKSPDEKGKRRRSSGNAKHACCLYVIAEDIEDATLISDESVYVTDISLKNNFNTTLRDEQVADLSYQQRLAVRMETNLNPPSPENPQLTSAEKVQVYSLADNSVCDAVPDCRCHLVICGSLRQSIYVIQRYRKLQARLFSYISSESVPLATAVIVSQTPHDQAAASWMANQFQPEELKGIYHVCETSTAKSALLCACVHRAAVIFLVDDSNVGAMSQDQDSAQYNADTSILLTYIGIEMILDKIPYDARPRIVVETTSTMTLHVLTKKMGCEALQRDDQFVSEVDGVSAADKRRGFSNLYVRHVNGEANEPKPKKKRSKLAKKLTKLFYSRSEIQKSYEHEYMAIPSYVSGHCISKRSMHAFLAQSRFTPGLIEIFQSLVATEDQSMKQRGGNARDMGAGSTLMKLFVPQKYIGKPFDELFEGLLREQGAVALALYRATHREDNDNVLPYVYTCPQRETTLNESDGVLVLMPPKQSGNVLTSSDDEDVEQKKTIRLSFSSEMMTPPSVQKAQPATTHHRKEKRQKKEKKSKKAKKAKKKRSSERSIEDVKIDVVEREEETKDPKNSSDEDFTF